MLLQDRGKTSGTCGSIRFAKEYLGRVPALVHRYVTLNELIECLQVLVHAGKVFGCGLTHRARISGERSIDKNKICSVEETVLVGNNLIRGATCGRRACCFHPHRPE